MSGSLILAFVVFTAADDIHHFSAAALSFTGRQRRSSSSRSSSQEQQLIRNEEAARLRRTGQAKRRQEKNARLEDRVSYLESLASTSDAQQKELDGLIQTRDSFEEQYDPTAFTKEHVDFKTMHNDAFIALARYCHEDRAKRQGMKDELVQEDPNVFYLDGPDGATTLALRNEGFGPSCCYVANRHLATCEILRDHLPHENVLHCTAAEALTPPIHSTMDGEEERKDGDAGEDVSFADIDFAAYYFDGCGGFVPHIVSMMTAALIRSPTNNSDNDAKRKTTAVGFSLMGGNRDVIQKEMEVCQALAIIARTRGMRTRHVLDDPGRFGVPLDISKIQDGTFTSWMLLEEE